MALIEADNLRKVYTKAARKDGPMSTLRTFFSREKTQIVAVDDISFSIGAGEVVGYIGPNGAGKSTTLKMLTGILVPTSGGIRVQGRIPCRDRQAHVRQIGVVFGQRSQLWWDLPTIESFEMLRHIYRTPLERWRENLVCFSDLLGLDEFVDTPVRQLSLGQRMRADLAAALLHDPAILFLDEPTIGLDVVAKKRIRTFLSEMNRERGVTIVLTTHDLSDIESLCPRVILIDRGRLIYDGELEDLRHRFGKQRMLVVDLQEEAPEVSVPSATCVRTEGSRAWLRFDRESTSAAELIAEVAARYSLRDLTVEEPEIETIIRDIYEDSSRVARCL